MATIMIGLLEGTATFMVSLLTKLASETFVAYATFKLLEFLATKTTNDVDNEVLAKVKEAYYDDPIDD